MAATLWEPALMPLPKSPAIGTFRNLALIQLWRDVPVDEEQSLPGYVDIASAWCSIVATAGDVLWSDGFATAERPTHVLTMRYREDLTHEHHIVVAGQRFRILRVQKDDARRFVRVDCELYGDASMVARPPALLPVAPIPEDF